MTSNIAIGPDNSRTPKNFWAFGYKARWSSQTQAGSNDGLYCVCPGDTVVITIQFENLGMQEWNKQNPVKLCVYKDPNISSSPPNSGFDIPGHQNFGRSYFRDKTWEEDSVTKGEIGTFNIRLYIPNDCPNGKYREDFALAVGGFWLSGDPVGTYPEGPLSPIGTAHFWVGVNVFEHNIVKPFSHLQEKNVADRLTKEFEENYEMYQRFGIEIDRLVGNIFHSEKKEKVIHTLRSRTKTVNSFHNKVISKNYSSLSDCKDICGVRVVYYFLKDKNLILEKLKGNFAIIEEVDKRDSLGVDRVGYKATHLIGKITEEQACGLSEYKNLFFEIQVCTILEDAWAVIEHDLVYKPQNMVFLSASIKRRINLLASILEIADNEFDQLKELEVVQTEIN